MSVFIQPGDEPLTAVQAINRGGAILELELARAGARREDNELFKVLPADQLPARLVAVLQNLGVTSYAEYASAWEADNEVNAANNAFNWGLAAYRQAKARLARYRLADGRPEITEQVATGEIDPQTGEPVMQTVVVQPAIDPLPATIEQPTFDEQTGEQTGTVTVSNPAVAEDDAERAAAQAVIDGTLAAVVAFDAAT